MILFYFINKKQYNIIKNIQQSNNTHKNVQLDQFSYFFLLYLVVEQSSPGTINTIARLKNPVLHTD